MTEEVEADIPPPEFKIEAQTFSVPDDFITLVQSEEKSIQAPDHHLINAQRWPFATRA